MKDKEQNSKKEAVENEKDEACETENLGVPIFYLRTHQRRNQFFQQNLPDMLTAQQTYNANDARA